MVKYHQHYTLFMPMHTLKFQVMLFMNFAIYCVSHVPLLVAPTPTHQISECLTLENVLNFTTYDTINSTNHYDYYKMLNCSIQNLRYADPSLPKPTAIIMPENLDQLRSALLCSRKANCHITIRSGGHSYEGTSSVGPPPFVIIDLTNFNRVTIDLESQTAWVEAGATLGQTYYAIAKATGKLGFSAGSCPTVGVGGHISGGGFGLLSRKHGLAVDNVVDALLVNADGQLLDRQSMGEEVFWAIRGGGGGVWGIVYAWKIKLLQVPPIVTAFVVSRPGPTSLIAELVNKWQHVAPYLEDDFYLSCFVGAGLPEAPKNYSGLSATFKGLYLGLKDDAIYILAREFPMLGIIEEDCIEMSWIESVVFFSGLDPGSKVSELGNRYAQDKSYFKAKSDYVQCLIPKEAIKTTLLSQLKKQPKGYVILDPYGGIMDRISSESIAFPHRKGNLYSIQYLVAWKKQEENIDNGNECMDWIRTLYNSMARYVSTSPRAAYINYMDFDLGVAKQHNSADSAVDIARVWGHKYFLDNFDRLVRAKTLIDPLNVFSNPQGIPPLSKFDSLSAI